MERSPSHKPLSRADLASETSHDWFWRPIRPKLGLAHGGELGEVESIGFMQMLSCLSVLHEQSSTGNAL
jgi:hypothetical protein